MGRAHPLPRCLTGTGSRPTLVATHGKGGPVTNLLPTDGIPTVTVLVCAYTLDRWADLVAALDSARRQDPEPVEVLLVVDHNPDLLARAADLPGVRVIPNQHTRGLSGARNTGVAAAVGDIVAFLDDDASARPDWLHLLLPHFADPAVEAAGGAAHPRWPGPRPAFYPAPPDASYGGELDWVVGCTYHGQPEVVSDVRNLMGCNMAFRRATLLEIGGFREDLGRIGTIPLGCEETELCIRVTQRRPGARIVFDPRSVVHHRVTDERTSWRYLLTRCFAEGMSKSVVARVVGRSVGLQSERSYVARVLPAAVLRELRDVGRGRMDGMKGAGALTLAPVVAGAGYLRAAVRRTDVEPSS